VRDGLIPLLTRPYAHLYVPVTYAFFWAGYHLWGNAAIGYHALNLACHLVSVALLYQILRVILKSRPFDRAQGGPERKSWGRWPALLACAWWAVHPLQVEPVAWITGLKDVLSVMFALCSWRLYIAWREPDGSARGTELVEGQPSRLLFGCSALAFLLACLSKPGVVLFPIVLAGYDVLIAGRKWRELRPLALFLLLAVLAAAVTMAVQRPEEAGVTIALSTRTRLFMAADSAAFYLKKILWPAALCPVYGRTMQDALAMPWAWVRVLIVCAAAAVAWLCGGRWRLAAILFAAGWAPISGLVPFGYQAYSTVADRYACLPALGAAIVLGDLIRRLAPEKERPANWPGIAARILVCVWILVFAALTWTQTAVWRNSLAVWEKTLESNRRPAAAVLANYGSALFHAGRNEDALRVLEQCVREKPEYALGHYDLGRVYQDMGQLGAARAEYIKALDRDPSHASAWVALGFVDAQTKDYDGCIESSLKALRLDPGNAMAADNLGLAVQMANPGEAVAALEEAVSTNPEDYEARFYLAVTLEKAGRRRDAQAEFLKVAAAAEGKIPSAFRAAAAARAERLGRTE